MANADVQYLTIAKNILDHGYYSNNRTGIPTYKLPHQIMQFDLRKEFPILSSKHVAYNNTQTLLSTLVIPLEATYNYQGANNKFAYKTDFSRQCFSSCRCSRKFI